MAEDPFKLIRNLVQAELTVSQHEKKRTVSRPPALVTICRDYGAAAEDVGRRLAKDLGVDYYDKELIDAIADESHMDRHLLERLDESVEGMKNAWLYAILPGVGDPRAAYTRNLVNILLGISRTGGVIVGRGAHLVLEKYGAFRIRIVGSVEVCAERVAASENLDMESARKRVNDMDKARADFIDKLYQRNLDEPRQYDLIIDSDRFEPAAMEEIILLASRHAHNIQPRAWQRPVR